MKAKHVATIYLQPLATAFDAWIKFAHGCSYQSQVSQTRLSLVTE